MYVAKKEGIKRLFSGFPIYFITSATSNTISLWCYEMIRSYILVNRNKNIDYEN
jgi:hypothetical protein